jgi:hypothetical protein
MGSSQSAATIDCLMLPPGSGIVITAHDPADPSPPGDVALAGPEGKGVVLRKPAGCTATDDELAQHWAEFQRTRDAGPLVRALVPGPEVTSLADACTRSLKGAASWRIKRARGVASDHCAVYAIRGHPGQQGRLDVIHPVDRAAKSPFIEQAEDAFMKIIHALLGNEPLVDGLVDLLATLLEKAF